MSKITDAEANATSLDGLVNDNALVPTLRNGPKPSYQYLVDGWNAEIAEAILEMNKSRGFRVVGTFADGFTYELFNDVAIDADGNSWIYVGAGAPNKVVPAGTVPSVGAGYEQVTFNDPLRSDLAVEGSGVLISGVRAGILSNRFNTKSVAEFGAVGDGVVDDTTALNDAFAFGRANDVKIVGEFGANYKITDTVVINCDSDMSGCRYVVDASFNKPAIRTSASLAGVNLLAFLNIKYPEVFCTRTIGTLPVSGSIGIKQDGVINGEFWFPLVYGFDTGILYYSDNVASYVAYNKNHYGKIVANRVNVHFLTESTGWANESSHYGGQWAQFSGDDSSFNTINLLMTKSDVGGNNPPNGHKFFGCSMEGAFSGGTVVQDFAGTNSFPACNVWFGCRFEGGIFFTFSPIALGQSFFGCWGESFLSYTDNVKPNGVGFRFFNYRNESAPSAGSATIRRNAFTPLFDVVNTGIAVAIGSGFSGRLNAAMTGAGSFESYNNTDENLLHPVVRSGLEGGRATLNMGFGDVAPDNWFKLWGGGQVRHNTSIYPFEDNLRSLGAASNRYANNYSVNYRPGTGTALWTSGAGTPEGVVYAPVGSMYTRTDGGANTTLYIKESGTNETGWVAK